MRVPHLVKDGGGDGERAAGVGHIHDARHAALAGAARQQQVDLPREGSQCLRHIWALSTQATAARSLQQTHQQPWITLSTQVQHAMAAVIEMCIWEGSYEHTSQ